ncbi:MAG: ABC transporter permease subunit [Oscillospiraceae bacterium]
MTKLLSAYFTRLVREKALWLFAAGMLLAAALVMLSGIQNDVRYGSSMTLEEAAFNSATFIGLFCAVAVTLFLGKEYSDGTVRNKLITGHKRGQIYLACLTASLAAAEIVAVAWFLGGLIGIPHFGLWTMAPEQLLLNLLLTALSTAALASVFCLVGMLVTNRTASVVASIFLWLGLLLLGSFLYNQLCEPEMTISGVTITAEGGLQLGDEIPNSAYVGGMARKVFTALLNILPTGQAILLANLDDVTVPADPALEAVGSVLLILLTTAAGVLAFRKKDLK